MNPTKSLFDRNRWVILGVVLAAALAGGQYALALSRPLPSPQLFYPGKYDAKKSAAIDAVLQSKTLHYLNGLTSYWPPEYGTTLVYGGDTASMNRLLADLSRLPGVSVRVTFSKDLSKETGSALTAGTYWVKYRHTKPDEVEVRVNLASKDLDVDKLDLVPAPPTTQPYTPE